VGHASAAKHGAGSHDTGRQARSAAQRAVARRARTRNRLLFAGGAIAVVVAAALVLVLLHGSGSSTPKAGGAPPSGTALTPIVGQLTSVPSATLDQIGAGQTKATPSSISGAALTQSGKPEMFYLGAEYCPYCAAERWAMISALSRFGTISGLSAIRSPVLNGAGTAEPYPNTATWTFAKAHYTSAYLAFTAVETNTSIPDKATGGYTALQTPTPAEQALVSKYDAAYQGAVPFIDFGNKYMSVGASYDPSVLTGLSWAQIAADLHNPASPVAGAVLGAANYMTAAICSLTGDKPASTCTSAITALQAKI
jgi:hypothetical protein